MMSPNNVQQKILKKRLYFFGEDVAAERFQGGREHGVKKKFDKGNKGRKTLN